MDMSQKPCDARNDGKHAGDQDRDPQFVRACATDMHMEMSAGRLFYAKILRKNAAPSFVPACPAKMQMDMSQKPFYAKIFIEKTGGSITGLNNYRRNLSVWTHCFDLFWVHMQIAEAH